MVVWSWSNQWSSMVPFEPPRRGDSFAPYIAGFHMRRWLGFAFFFENIENFWIFLVLSGQKSETKNPKFRYF